MNYQEKVAWLGRYQTALSCQRMLEEEITCAAQRCGAGDGVHIRYAGAQRPRCRPTAPRGGTYRRCAEKAGAAAG